MPEDLTTLIRRSSKRIRPLPVDIPESGRLPRAPRAVLFDVYGTLLVQANNPHAAGGPEGLEERISAEHVRLHAQGIRFPEVKIEEIWGKLFPDRSSEELRTMIVRHELAAHPVWPMPGSRRLIRFLANRGMALGVISNAQSYTPLFLEALLGFSPSLCIYSCDFGEAKPSQRLFQSALERLGRLGVGPQEALMIGNSHPEDIVPAAAAARPDAVVRSLRRLMYMCTPDEL